MTEKTNGAERVQKHFERPQTELHKGGRSAGQRALIAGAVVAGGILTAPIWAPVVVGVAYVAVVTLTVTAAVAVATAPVWAPLALIGWAAQKAYKAGAAKTPKNTIVPGDLPKRFTHVYPQRRDEATRDDARRVTDSKPPRAERRRPVLDAASGRASIISNSPAPRRRRSPALPRL